MSTFHGRKRLSLSGLLLITTLLVSACGSDDGDDSSGTAAPSEPTLSGDTTEPTAGGDTTEPTAGGDTTEPPSGDGPQQGGTFVIPLDAPPSGGLVSFFNPGIGISQIARTICNTILSYDENGEPVGNLAEDFEVSADGLTWTIRLPEDATWHDGTPLTAADLEFSATEFWANDPLGGNRLKTEVSRYEVVDDHTFAIHLNQPFALMYDILDLEYPLPKHIYEGTDYATNPNNQAPICSGPFKFEEWVPGSHVTVTRNESYFKDGLPHLDRIIFQESVDPSAREIAFESGDIDFLNSYAIPYNKLGDWRDDDRFTVVDNGLGVGTADMMLINLDSPILSNSDVRRAIAHALDREAMNEVAFFGEGKAATSHVASTVPFYTDEFNVEYDPSRAEELLDEAGYPRQGSSPRFELRLDYAIGREYERRMAEIAEAQLEEVGIDVTLGSADPAAFIQRTFRDRDFDLAITLWATGPDPGFGLTRRYLAANIGQPSLNAMGYDNPDLEAILNSEYRELARDARAEAWRQVQEILATEMPTIPLVEIPNVQVHSSEFADVVTDAVYGYVYESHEYAYATEP